LNIPDGKEENFDDNINFYILCLLPGGNTVYEILMIGLGERRSFINNIFQSPLRKSSFRILYFVGIKEFFNNVMFIGISDFYTMINLYTIIPTVVKSVNIETIRQRRNCDTYSNDNIYLHGVIIDE